MTRAWTRSCAACSVRKGLIFLMLCRANLQDWAVWSLKVSCSSKITPRFLTELDGVIVEEPNWMLKSCCRVWVSGKTRSSVFARLSCRWKNITIILSYYSNSSINILWSEKLHLFVINRSFIKVYLTLYGDFWTKYQPVIHNSSSFN